MRSKTADPTDGQRRPRRGREKWVRRWGRIERDDLEALVAELEGGDEVDEMAAASAAWLDAISKVSGAILCGATLVTETYLVGPLPTGEELAKFGCKSVRDGRMIEVFQAFDEGGLDERGPYAVTHRERDWSAFGAARAFVDSVGPKNAMLALQALHEAKTAQRPAARPRPPVVIEVVRA
ncbi:hypothetical protein [Polyangium mundeleinium]|uniref:Uncharacterized protein n=1 Tax=Polyangium mundeleinium TaxID=2995306 RepID=A0ABT5EW44_9BACT|nr:hypothetical protein [Polyangium mundeleinium]MDC0745644.1 hypothetical protein [Polyangium mundeleinium]